MGWHAQREKNDNDRLGWAHRSDCAGLAVSSCECATLCTLSLLLYLCCAFMCFTKAARCIFGLKLCSIVQCIQWGAMAPRPRWSRRDGFAMRAWRLRVAAKTDAAEADDRAGQAAHEALSLFHDVDLMKRMTGGA